MDSAASQHGHPIAEPIPYIDGAGETGNGPAGLAPDHFVDEVTLALARAIDAKDTYTHDHSYRVGDLALRMGLALGLGEDAAWNLRRAGVLHDIGKIGMPDCILTKTGPLTRGEFEIVKKHPVCGAQILSKLPGLEVPARVALHHHEHFDGSGYPAGLRGIEIPIEARIISVVDALDAMTSNRPYRAAMCREAATEIIGQHAGSQFDPDVVAAFVPLAKNGFFDDILEHSSAAAREAHTGH